jgi:hypothetical protein
LYVDPAAPRGLSARASIGCTERGDGARKRAVDVRAAGAARVAVSVRAANCAASGGTAAAKESAAPSASTGVALAAAARPSSAVPRRPGGGVERGATARSAVAPGAVTAWRI